MSILVYLRPFSKSVFSEVANRCFSDYDIHYISDFKSCNVMWSGEYLYDEAYDYIDEDLTPIIDDIVMRDRTLRIMQYELAAMLVRRFWNGIRTLFRVQFFSYALILPVDCYTLDIIDRVAKLYGITVISFIGTFLSNYTRFSVRGEFHELHRNVSDHEVSNVLKGLLKTDYLPASEIKNIKANPKTVCKYFMRRKLIEEIYYPILKYYYRDKFNYHYNMYYLRDRKLSDYYDSQYDSYFEKSIPNDWDKKLIVFFPMHLIPEATTDYWCKNILATNYLAYISKLIENSDKNIKFLIKEHPAMYGKRLLNFYSKLKAYSNVCLIHPFVRSNNLLASVENVIVDNGTIGVESLDSVDNR